MSTLNAVSVDAVDNGSEERVTDTGATHYTIGSLVQVFNLCSPRSETESAIVGNDMVIAMLAVGSLHLKFHVGTAEKNFRLLRTVDRVD